MPATTAHPSQEQLSAYNLGQLPQDEALAIESHISECEPCCDTIVALSSDDTFVGLLKEARQLPTDQTVDQDGGLASPSSTSPDVPAPLAEHPRYEVIELIGKGGMGDVYEARHRMMDRTVALKIINRELMQKPEVVDRFHREVRAAAQLSHPNLVAAHDAEQAGDVHFMVMEYVDGVNLSQTVDERGALPISEACEYIRQAAIGLQHAHERGMVHRDIKPHNLMVTADGTVKILDFGLASLAPETLTEEGAVEARGDLTVAGAIMGTPDFISPEQAEDAHQADIRSDIYSLGATLYFLLAGRPPFAEGGVVEKLRNLAESEPESLASLREDVPADLVEAVRKMIAKDPDQRFQSPAEVVEALQSITASTEPSTEAMPKTGGKPSRWKPRLSWLTAVAALFAVVLAGAIYYIATDHGVVRVEVIDPSLQVSISGHTITMKDADGKTLTIRPGEQTLIVRKEDADFEFETDRFEVRRGDEIAFKVEMVQGEIVVRKDGEPFDRAPLLVGEWVGAAEDDNRLRLKFDVNGKFEGGFFHPAMPQLYKARLFGTYKTDFSVSPAHLDLDATIVYPAFDPEKAPPIENDGPAEAAPEATGPTRDRPLRQKHKFELIVEVVDVNTLHLSYPYQDKPRPKAFGEQSVVLHRQGVKNQAKPDVKGRPLRPGMSSSLKLAYNTKEPKGPDFTTYKWKFDGQNVGEVTVKLLLAQDGKTTTARELVYRNAEKECSFEVHFDVSNKSLATARNEFAPQLKIVADGLEKTSENEEKDVFPATISGTFQNRVERNFVGPISSNETQMVYSHGFWSGDLQHGTDMKGMIDATNKGATFVFVTLDWKPVGDPGISPTNKRGGECEAIRAALREYYMDKYPLFAESVNQRLNMLSSAERLLDRETRRQIGELAINSPVSEVINSFPGKPFVTFTEVTQASPNEVSVVCVDLYPNANGTCRVEVTKRQRQKAAGQPAAKSEPITEEEVRELVLKAKQDLANHENDVEEVSGDDLELSPELSKVLRKSWQSLPEFHKNLKIAVSEAAGIPNDQWETFAKGETGATDAIEGTPLSKLLLMSAPVDSSPAGEPPAPRAFRMLTSRMPKPLELHKAMAPSQPHGYVSLIQPEYVIKTTLDFDRKAREFRGTVWFKAPDLYAGKVDFAMFYHVGRMKIIEFDLPELGIKLVQDDDLWVRRRSATESEPSDAQAVEDIPDHQHDRGRSEPEDVEGEKRTLWERGLDELREQIFGFPAEEAETDLVPAEGQSESSDDFERQVAKWVLGNGGVVVVKNTAGRYENVEQVDELPARPFALTHIGMKSAKTLTDEDLKRLEGLHLSTLALSGTQVTDAGLTYLKRVPQLDYLVLNHCPRISLSDVSDWRHVKALSLRDTPAVSEDALTSLEELPDIWHLDIGENRQFTDRALIHISKLTTLKILALDSTAISDAGLKHLAPLDELYSLNLASTAISDAGLKHLAPLDELYSLNLASTAISDAGLKHLESLDLYDLKLDSTAISDAGLKHLASHDGLRRLSLNGTGVSAQGLKELRTALHEECKIAWDGEPTTPK